MPWCIKDAHYICSISPPPPPPHHNIFDLNPYIPLSWLKQVKYHWFDLILPVKHCQITYFTMIDRAWMKRNGRYNFGIWYNYFNHLVSLTCVSLITISAHFEERKLTCFYIFAIYLNVFSNMKVPRTEQLFSGRLVCVSF